MTQKYTWHLYFLHETESKQSSAHAISNVQRGTICSGNDLNWRLVICQQGTKQSKIINMSKC